MPISLLKKDNSRRNLLDVFDLMQSGEIYTPDETGIGGEFIVQKNRYIPDPSGQVSDLAPFQRETGVKDYMTSQTAESDAERLMRIQEMTGAGMIGLENKLQFDPSAVERFEDMSSADKLAAQMVQTGQMNPKDFYSIQKKSELDIQKAMLDFFSNIDPQKSPISLMSEGQDVPMTGENFMELMKPEGKVDVKVGRPYPSVNYNFPGAGGGTKEKYVSLRATDLSEAEKTSIAAITEGQTLLTNLVNTYKSSGYGGAGSMVGEKTAKIPLAGKYLAPKHAEYQKQKELASEVWLRAATGAATNPDEIKRYAGFLPDESDPSNLADSKMDKFFTKIMAKVDGRADAIEVEAKALESLGQFELANAKRTEVSAIKNLITQARTSIPRIVPLKTSNISDEDKVKAFLQKRKK